MLEIRLLGRFEVKLDGRTVTLSSRPAQSLLAYLAISAGTAHRREKLAGLLWPDSSDDNARRNLRQSLWHIRKTLGEAAPHFLHSDDMTVSFAAADFWLDVALLEKPVGVEATPKELMAIVAVYGGELLSGFYDDWVVWQRERQQSLFERKMEQLLDRLTAVHRWDDLLEWGERWLAFGHSSEAAYRALMVAHAGHGDLPRMAAVYRRCVDALENDLGVEPSPQTRALFERLAHNQESDVLAATLFPLPYQLAEEAGRESQIHQTQPAWQPPDSSTAVHAISEALSDTHPHSPPPHNLPPQPNRFIGRDAEVTAVHYQLAYPTTRLLTLTGTGGTGKTRLCLQVAAAARPDFADGVWFVPLAAISDPTLVAATIARQLGLQESPGMPPWPEVLADYLREKQLLLVLDNFEQIVTAAPLLADLITAVPHLKILVTSRVRLHLTNEQSYAVLPLLLPDPEELLPLTQLAQVEAVQLFVERARDAKPAFALTPENAPDVAEICARLDGLPLAIELAAARIRLMLPRQMRERLNRRLQWLTGGARDAPARQQTLRATLDWSYDLLPAAEQILFRRLAVFVGGCTLEAAEAVANAGGNLDILNGLESLLDHHLLQQQEVAGEPRFTMLETIREYALEKLDESGETEAMWQQHAAYFVALVETAEPGLEGAEQLTWLDLLDAELDNVRIVLERATKGQLQDVEAGLRVASALEQFWEIRDPSEGAKWLEMLLEKGNEVSPSVQAKALLGSGLLSDLLGRLKGTERINKLSQESLALYQQIGDKKGMARSLSQLGHTVRRHGGEHDQAIKFLEQSLALFRELDDQLGMGDALHGLGGIAERQHEYEQATTLYEQALTLYQNVGNKSRLCLLCYRLGRLAYEQKTYKRAVSFSTDSLILARGLNSNLYITRVLNLVGELARLQGDYEQAAKFYEEGLALAQKTSIQRLMAMMRGNLGYVALHQGSLPQAKALFKEVLVFERELGGLLEDVSWCLIGMAGVAGKAGLAERAAQLFGVAAGLLAASNKRLDPLDQAEYERYLMMVRAQLDEETFNRAWATGQAMSLEEAIALALQDT